MITTLAVRHAEDANAITRIEHSMLCFWGMSSKKEASI
jgi:hypothetical protein